MKLTSLVKISFLFSITLSQLKVSAQRNFKQGYIIDLKSDTVKGEIKYHNWSIMPKRIEFRKDAASGTLFYSPADIKEFGVSGDKYLGAITPVEKSANKIHELDYASAFKLVTDTIFIKEIAAGNKPVYYHKDYKGKLNFFIASDTGIVLLLYKIYRQEDIDYERQMTTVAKDESYKARLYAYLQDCPAVGTSIRKMKYELRDFRLLLDEYHSCKEDKPGRK